MNKDIVETVSGALAQLTTPILKQQKVIIYLAAIEAVTPITLATARRLVVAKAISGLMSSIGYEVSNECLMDDSPELVKTLQVSIWLRYLELCGKQVIYSENCYQGDYIFDFAATVHRNYGDRWAIAADEIHDDSDNWDDDSFSIQTLHGRMQQCIDEEGMSVLAHTGIEAIARDINNDLHDLSFGFDSISTASELITKGIVENSLVHLQVKGLVRSEGDNQYLTLSGIDEVLLVEKDEPSRFFLRLIHTLMAYQKENDLFICIYDIDQTEQIQWIKHCVIALGQDISKWKDKPVQAPLLSESGELVHTSPLSEDFVSFREAQQTIGLEYLRFIFLQQNTQRCKQIELLDNPPIEAWLSLKSGFSFIDNIQGYSGEKSDSGNLAEELYGLSEKQQQSVKPLIQLLSNIPNVLAIAEDSMEPAVLVKFLQNLFDEHLSYYNNHMVREGNKYKHGVYEDNTAITPIDAFRGRYLAYVYEGLNKMLGGQLIQQRRAYEQSV